MKRPWVLGILVLCLAAVAGCADEEAGERTLTAFVYSLPADVADVAYEISVFPDGLISRIIRYESTTGSKAPEVKVPRNESFVQTDEYMVSRTDDAVALHRLSPDGSMNLEMEFIETNTDEIRPYFDGLDTSDDRIVIDNESHARYYYEDRVIADFRIDGDSVILTMMHIAYRYVYEEDRLVQFTFTGLASGTEWEAILCSPRADRYTLTEPSRGDPVPYLQKFDVFGEVASASLRITLLNFYLLYALDDGDRSHLLAFFAAPR